MSRGDRRAVARGELVDRVLGLLDVRPAGADHEDHARTVAGADRDVVGPGRAVQVVPLAHAALLALDDGDALAAEHEEALLGGLGVVAAVGLAGHEHVRPDAELRERGVARAEVAPDAEVAIALPARLGEVEDEPALALDDLPGLGLLERGLRDRVHASRPRRRRRPSPPPPPESRRRRPSRRRPRSRRRCRSRPPRCSLPALASCPAPPCVGRRHVALGRDGGRAGGRGHRVEGPVVVEAGRRAVAVGGALAAQEVEKSHAGWISGRPTWRSPRRATPG